MAALAGVAAVLALLAVGVVGLAVGDGGVGESCRSVPTFTCLCGSPALLSSPAWSVMSSGVRDGCCRGCMAAGALLHMIHSFHQSAVQMIREPSSKLECSEETRLTLL